MGAHKITVEMITGEEMALIVYTVSVPVSFSGVKVKGEENVLMALIITNHICYKSDSE